MDLHDYDAAIRARGFHAIAGIDEAGRGPVAGPVVASAVILAEGSRVDGIQDSKKLTPGQREGLYKKIVLYSQAVGIGIVWEAEIDSTDILKATRRAMEQAVRRLCVRPDLLLIDAVRLAADDIPQIPLIKGDATSASIAAASIVAKVTRDRIMSHYHTLYPAYGFDRHKGYGTRDHLTRISDLGPCPIHRRTFQGVRDLTLPWE